ncbi:RNA-binding protein [Bacillota bacterium Lsc_1132]
MNIYQHFRHEEKDFIDQVLNWKSSVEKTYAPKLTDFLDPREQQIVKLIFGENSDVKVEFFGGTAQSERKRAMLLPDYLTADQGDFQIRLYEVEYPSKFITIEHRQVLGSLMSVGLKRGKFGDILVKEKQIQFFVSADVGDYIEMQVKSIGKATVDLLPKTLDEALVLKDVWTEEELTVSSLRLDTAVSGIHHLARQKSQILIQQGLVKVNWTLIDNPSFELKEGDMISARGHGRVKILSIEGKTKKEKWRIRIGKQK